MKLYYCYLLLHSLYYNLQLSYNDPREGGRRQWSMAERRSREGDDVFPDDTAPDFSKETSNVHDERLRQVFHSSYYKIF